MPSEFGQYDGDIYNELRKSKRSKNGWNVQSDRLGRMWYSILITHNILQQWAAHNFTVFVLFLNGFNEQIAWKVRPVNLPQQIPEFGWKEGCFYKLNFLSERYSTIGIISYSIKLIILH